MLVRPLSGMGGGTKDSYYVAYTTSATFTGNNPLTFSDDFDMVIFYTTSGSATDYVHNNYLYKGSLIPSSVKSNIVSFNGGYKISGCLLDVKNGDTLGTNVSSFPTSIFCLKKID